MPGIFGGQDFHDANGQPAGYTVESVISGEDFYRYLDGNCNTCRYCGPVLFQLLVQ